MLRWSSGAKHAAAADGSCSEITVRPDPSRSLGVGDRVEGPDWAADSGEQFGSVDLRTERAGVDEHDLAGDRLEGSAEMLHRLDRDGAVAGRVDAERGELGEIDSLAVIGDDDDVDGADAEHHRQA